MKINNSEKKIKNEIIKNGYESLRVSIFNDRDNQKEEWQTRIEYCAEKDMYAVYSLGDRNSLMGNIREFKDFNSAKEAFFRALDLTVTYNKLRIEENEQPDYDSPLWN